MKCWNKFWLMGMIFCILSSSISRSVFATDKIGCGSFYQNWFLNNHTCPYITMFGKIANIGRSDEYFYCDNDWNLFIYPLYDPELEGCPEGEQYSYVLYNTAGHRNENGLIEAEVMIYNHPLIEDRHRHHRSSIFDLEGDRSLRLRVLFKKSAGLPISDCGQILSFLGCAGPCR